MYHWGELHSRCQTSFYVFEKKIEILFSFIPKCILTIDIDSFEYFYCTFYMAFKFVSPNFMLIYISIIGFRFSKVIKVSFKVSLSQALKDVKLSDEYF